MIIVKFIVLFGCISVLSALQTYYCEICSNHTMCKYKVPGPRAACKLYNKGAFLSSVEIKELVQNINERRSFVAAGRSKVLPQASNMKKIKWSPKLASFAQRWADQCDPFLHPDKEDDCRDLDNVEVGQNVGSVTGTSPGLNVKSFVEMWFIQILDYTGNVTYYNKTCDNKTNYFTQLIWAETEFVGCGKVKFYISEKKVMIERLVCNFAPKGNIHGKSIYSIGYPGTQCANNMINNKGLCDHIDTAKWKILRNPKPTENSLLRIIYLSNNTVKEEIDPLHNQLVQTTFKNKIQKKKKIRHVQSKNIYDSRRLPLRKQNIRKNIIQNMSRTLHNDDYPYQQEKGRSHFYHGHENHDELQTNTPNPTTNYFEGNNNQDFRRNDYSTPNVYLMSSSNYRKYYDNQECSRNTGQRNNHCCQNNYECTREHYPNCQEFTACPRETFTNPIISPNLCPCTTRCPTTCPTICHTECPPFLTTADNCNTNCKCMDNSALRDGGRSYNNIPNMVRSGEEGTTQEISSPKIDSDEFYDENISKPYKRIRDKEIAEVGYDEIHSKYNDRDYAYHSIDSRLREKRQLKNETDFRFRKSNTTKSHDIVKHKNRTEIIALTRKHLSNGETKYLRKGNNNNTDFNKKRISKYKNFEVTRYPKARSKVPYTTPSINLITTVIASISSGNNDCEHCSQGTDAECCKMRCKLHGRNSYYKNAVPASRNNISSQATHNKYSKSDSVTAISSCNCKKNRRIKREKSSSSIDDTRIMSYADLFYLVLDKITQTKSRDNTQCQCNGTTNNFYFLYNSFCLILHLFLFLA